MMKKKGLLLLIFQLIAIFSMSIPVFAATVNEEEQYSFGIISSGDGGLDMSEFKNSVIRAGWGWQFSVGLYRKDSTEPVSGVRWDAVLTDGTIVEPSIVTPGGRGNFVVPFETTGEMTVRAYLNDEIAKELTVIILTEKPDGSPISGWREVSGEKYYINKSGALAKGWKSLEEKWYLFSPKGVMQVGWTKVKGTWYYLRKDGSMASNEWIGGYWLSKDGAWKYKAEGRWRKNSKGWWFEDERGWYPKAETVKINNIAYTFDEAGYLVEN